MGITCNVAISIFKHIVETKCELKHNEKIRNKNNAGPAANFKFG